MPDVERLLEHMVEGLAALTKQVSRLANAVEEVVLETSEKGRKACRSCSSQVQPLDHVECLACGEDMSNG